MDHGKFILAGDLKFTPRTAILSLGEDCQIQLLGQCGLSIDGSSWNHLPSAGVPADSSWQLDVGPGAEIVVMAAALFDGVRARFPSEGVLIVDEDAQLTLNGSEFHFDTQGGITLRDSSQLNMTLASKLWLRDQCGMKIEVCRSFRASPRMLSMTSPPRADCPLVVIVLGVPRVPRTPTVLPSPWIRTARSTWVRTPSTLGWGVWRFLAEV